MKICNHLLARDDGLAARGTASPHTGGVIVPRFLAVHHTASSSFAPLPGTPVPPDTEVDVLEKAGLGWQVDVAGEVTGLMKIVGRCHFKYLEQING